MDRIDKKTGNKQKETSPAQRLTFAFIALGFTLISVVNGFNFYRVLFGLVMAVLISVTFEVARFACLFRYMQSGKKAGLLTITLYLVTAAVCAFASINSFTSEVIKRNRLNDKAFQQQIKNIKQVYAGKHAGELADCERDINYLENKVAKSPGSGYWKRRLSQMMDNRKKLIEARDRYLDTVPDDPVQWIRKQSALLGLELPHHSEENEEVLSVGLALRELWDMDKITAQKIMGIVVTLTVELAIFILAILATASRKPAERVDFDNKLEEKILSNFSKKTVARFIKQSKDYFLKTGTLPPTNSFTTNLRPLRVLIGKFDRAGLKELFDQEL